MRSKSLVKIELNLIYVFYEVRTALNLTQPAKFGIRTLSQLCPCCRQRFTSWYRHAIKNNQLIDQKLWKQIQRDNGVLLKFGEKIEENPIRTPLTGKILIQGHQIRGFIINLCISDEFVLIFIPKMASVRS